MMKESSREQYDVTDDRLAKLPRWAKAYLQHLEREVEHVREHNKVLTALGTEEESEGSMISWLVDMNEQRWLPKHTTVRFHYPKIPGERNRHLDVMWRGGYEGTPYVLDLNTQGSLLVQPRAGNSAWIHIPTYEMENELHG